MFRRAVVAAATLLAMTIVTVSSQVVIVVNPVVPLFPNADSACKRCANANNNPLDPNCLTAFKGVPGKFCNKWLSSGVQQACCCPQAAQCAKPSLKSDTCGCLTPALHPRHHVAKAAEQSSSLFPNPTSACQKCANANNNPNDPNCLTAFKGVPGKFCNKFLSSGVAQACCCPVAATCPAQTNLKADKCGCDTPGKPTTSNTTAKKSTPVWLWIVIALGVVTLAVVIGICCCSNNHSDDVVVVSHQPVVMAQPGVVYGQPTTVVYGHPGYASGGDVAAGVAVGAAVGVLGGVALGAAIAGDHGGYDHGGYNNGGYDNGGGGGGGDFGGDF
ncbi:Aste57867_8251 [Aphanomyces stellatus]|uniref:Aste57867_8251 protein n=1 Tax=Aphanomyces stellatus TaxID=120398 RepID=A0A485KJS8_9STRA|nr:hypothetical protein As57867_008220 [Aphanomyces stellatus]VFT85138.1 Aste57867_8251 [Aphanomyces stellatus]